jgi:Ca-activated chloride channel family protein
MHGWRGAALLLIGFARVAEPQDSRQDSRPDFQISVNVDLVVLQATVRDRGGRIVSDLREQDFEVYEDGVRQTIKLFRHEDVPVTVGLIVDHSGSMLPKLTDVIAAARTFARSSNPEDGMFVVNFNEKVTLGLPGGMNLTNSPDELERAIAATRPMGRTALYDAAVTGLEHLQAGGPEKKALIVISAGGDNASVLHLPAVLKKFEQSSAVIYAIGVFDEDDPDQNPDVLRRLARSTGGEAFFPARPGDVVAICERIARDIRHQYTIGYVSTSTTPPGALRTVRMVAHAAGKGGLSVRTRTGYIPLGTGGIK